MSHIFDALQLSEAERTSSARLIAATATELLERAERHAAELWQAESNIANVSNSDLPELDLPIGMKGLSAEAPSEQPPGDANAMRFAERSAFFSDVQTIAVTPVQQDRLVCLTDKDTPAAEAFRLLGVRLRHSRKERRLKRVLITSTVPQEGKSFAAANFACALGWGTDEKVLLLEGDLRRPTLSQLFGLSSKSGICECVLDEGSLSSNIYKLEGGNVWVWPAGTKHCNPLDVIQSQNLPALLDQLTALFDWVIIDTPPILPLADTTAWARLADGVLLVTRRGVTEKQKFQRGIEAIDSNKLIGAILNSSSGTSEHDYYYYSRP